MKHTPGPWVIYEAQEMIKTLTNCLLLAAWPPLLDGWLDLPYFELPAPVGGNGFNLRVKSAGLTLFFSYKDDHDGNQ